MRTTAALLATLLFAGCKDYVYEEEYFLQVDGSGELRVSGSELVFPVLHPRLKEMSEDALGEYFATPSLSVVSVQDSTRGEARFYHVRGRFESWNRLCEHGAFAARTCSFVDEGDALALRTVIRAETVPIAEGTGSRLIAFRFHIPSALRHHNAPDGIQRGNIVGWERTLEEHLTGAPLSIEARFDHQSVLAMALQVLGLAILLVLLTIGVSLLIIYRIGRKQLAREPAEQSTP